MARAGTATALGRLQRIPACSAKGGLTMPRVLYLCHGHPAFVPGGTETVAHDLFCSVRDRRGWQAMFLGCVSPLHRQPRPEARFQTIGRSADEMLLWVGAFDRFMLSQTESRSFVDAMSELLSSFRPDVVHFHHLSRIGLEAVLLVKRLLPGAKTILTLHDYFAICANDGLMTRPGPGSNGDGNPGSGRLCPAAGPDACHRCFPEVPQARFAMRSMHIKNVLGTIDWFVAPSAFLRDRYIAWGLPAARMSVVANGLRPSPAFPLPTAGRRRKRNVFGFFGNIAPHKGVLVALAAARQLTVEGVEVSLRLHGGINFQSEQFCRAYDDALQAAGPSVIDLGPYQREQLPLLMSKVDWAVVPSVWWENAPLVILEAFQHRRPVICSDIGGMAELVEHGVAGLHFRAGDAADLARTMQRAARQPALWQRLSQALPEPAKLDDAVDHHLELYSALLSKEEALSA